MLCSDPWSYGLAGHPEKFEFCEDGQREKIKISKEPEGTDRVTEAAGDWPDAGNEKDWVQDNIGIRKLIIRLWPTASLARMMLKWKGLGKNRARNLGWRISKDHSRFLD